MNINKSEEQDPPEMSMVDWLSIEQPFGKPNVNRSQRPSANNEKDFGLLNGRTAEQDGALDNQQNDTDSVLGIVNGSACQTDFGDDHQNTNVQPASGSCVDSLPSNPDGYSVNLSDCTAQNVEDWLTNSELERFQMSGQKTTDYTLQDIKVSERVASNSYHPDHRYQAAGDDAVETKDIFQFGDLQRDAQQGIPEEYTNPTYSPVMGYASTGPFQVPGLQNPIGASWEGMGFVQSDSSMLRATESRTFNPKSLSGWNTIAHETPQWNFTNQMSEVDRAQRDVLPNLVKVDSDDRGASWSSELRDEGTHFGPY